MTGTEPIKLFIDAHVFDNEYQGSRTFIKELYNHLASKKDIEFYFAAFNIENLRHHFPKTENIHFIKYKYRYSIARLMLDIPAIIKKYDIGYAHFQYIVPLQKKCRFIVTTHDILFNDYPKDFSFWYRFNKNLLYKIAAKKADILTTVSEYSRNAIQKCFKLKNEAIHVLPNGISSNYFLAYQKSEAINYINNKFGLEKYLLYVSRIEPRKNHTGLLQAYLDLKLYKEDYHLVFIGHQSISTPEFDHLLYSLPGNIRSCIRFFDDLNEEDLLDFYKAATVFVYPSKAEGFGFPPLEAAALKIPVLCSNNTALSDFSFFEQYHIDISNREIFKEKLSALIENTDPISLETIAGSIRQKYDWQKTAETFYNLLKENNTI
jgi:glycosyltransferase involved in cell wall biosynthesis